MKIKYIQIYGERCSGTSFLQKLIDENFKEVKLTWKYGWKHFFPKYNFYYETDTLFLVIFRDVFNWLRSFYNQPFHVAEELRVLSFSDFIRSDWKCVWNEESGHRINDPVYGNELMAERNPETGDRFKNILQLRSAKISSLMDLKKRVKHVYYVRYEDLLRRTRDILKDISHKYNLKLDEDINTNIGYRGTKAIYRKKLYPLIRYSDYLYIKRELDLSLELRIGYKIANKYPYRIIKELFAMVCYKLKYIGYKMMKLHRRW